MRKYTSLFCLLGAFSAGAMTPNEAFYLPTPGAAVLEGTAEWSRAFDRTGTDTKTAVKGIYGIDGGKAGFVRIGSLAGETPILFERAFGRLPAIPEIGARILDNVLGLDTALDMAYGTGRFSSDRRNYDKVTGRFTVGKKDGLLRGGVFVGGNYFFHFHKNAFEGEPRLKNMTRWTFGGQVAYDIAPKWTLQTDYEHTFKERVAVLSVHKSLKNATDRAKVSLAYEFKPRAFITPYGGYTWLRKGYGVKNEKIFGVKMAVTF